MILIQNVEIYNPEYAGKKDILIGGEKILLIQDSIDVSSLNNIEIISKGRHRIEHAEYLHDDQLERVNKLGIILSMQPNFPGRWGKEGQLYETCLGPQRYKKLNNFRKILKEKALVAFGSDNMPLSPIFGIWSVATHPIYDIKISAEEAEKLLKAL